jgi:hypothetical protein
MRTVAGVGVAAATALVRHGDMTWDTYDSRSRATVELARELVRWDAARMALEAARLRRKAPGAAGAARPEK